MNPWAWALIALNSAGIAINSATIVYVLWALKRRRLL